jgi:WhiB family transcriptional regulator, redox-sensing transcriptional regulator
VGRPSASAESWRDDAACIGADPRIFTDPRPDTDDTRQAVALCRSCPVRQPCLATALAHHPDADVGIWGGMTPQGRQAIRRERAAPVPTPAAIGLHHTLDGDLTDLTGRAHVVILPVPPTLLLLVDRQPALRTDQLDDIRRYLTATLDDYRPDRLAPLSITSDGDLADPTGRVTITRLPAPPHLLVTTDGTPYARAHTLVQARQQALDLLVSPSADRAAQRRPPSTVRSLARR